MGGNCGDLGLLISRAERDVVVRGLVGSYERPSIKGRFEDDVDRNCFLLGSWRVEFQPRVYEQVFVVS